MKAGGSIEEFGLVRIDDRLIHGQVIAVWCRHRRFTRIVIADDGVAADEFMQEVLRLAAPPDLRVEVYSLADAARVLSADAPDRATTMVLLKSPQSAKRLHDRVPFRALNIGGIGSGPGRKNIFRNISVSGEEVAILRELLSRGVEVTLLTVPGETSRSFRDLAGRL